MLRSAAFAAVAVAVAAVLLAAAPAQGRGLTTGFFELWPEDGGARLAQARESGASMVRVQVFWRNAAPTRPANPGDPNDAAYGWAQSDRIVAEAKARGLRVLLSISHAPDWAYGPDRPADPPVGSWRPDPEQTGLFAGAVAAHYAGQARHVQLWNEPNLTVYLSPQEGASEHYRAMLNAAYGPVHAAGMRLVTAGTAPYGGGGRTPPLDFWRGVLAAPTRFDILAHQPYSVGAPQIKAENPGDVSIREVGALRKVIARAVKRGRARPKRPKPTWVTELSWDSGPPDPNGVPVDVHARWLADAFAILWRQGVDHVFWTRVRDEPEGPGGWGASYQSGVFYIDGTPKPAQRAFAFPLSCLGGRIWVRAPVAGTVRIMRAGRRVARRRTGADRIATVRLKGRGPWRAKIAGQRSLPCRR